MLLIDLVNTYGLFKGIAIANTLQKKVKISEFYNRSMKPWLQENATEIYSTYNEKKFIVMERFIRNLNNKSYKYMTSISKNASS